MALKPFLTALAAAVLLGGASAALAEDPTTADTPLPGDVQFSQPATSHHKIAKVHGSSNLSTAQSPDSASGRPARKRPHHAAPAKSAHGHSKAVRAHQASKPGKTHTGKTSAKTVRPHNSKSASKTKHTSKAAVVSQHAAKKQPQAHSKHSVKKPLQAHGKRRHASAQHRVKAASKAKHVPQPKAHSKKPAKN